MNRLFILASILLIITAVAWGGGQVDQEKASETVKTVYENSWENYRDEPITLTIFFDYPNDLNISYIEGSDLLVPKTVREETGVSLKSTQGVDATEQSLNLLAASGDYPDLMFIKNERPIAAAFIANSQIWAFDDLKDKYGIDVIRHININQRFTQRSRFMTDKIYYITNHGWHDEHMDSPWIVKWQTGPFVNEKWYKQLGSPAINSFDDLISFGKNAKAATSRFESPIWIHRDTNRGMFNEPAEVEKLFQYYGLNDPSTYWKVGGTHKFAIQAPAYIDLVRDLNRMVHEEMLNPLIWTASKADKLAMVMNGSCVVVLNDDTDNLLKRSVGMQAKYPDERYVMLAPFSANPAKYQFTAAGFPGAGGDTGGWCVPISGKNTIRSAAFVDYIMSDHFQRMNQWGLEGVHYTMVDGTPQWKSEFIGKDRDYLLENYGVNVYGGLIRDDYWAMIERLQRMPEMTEGLDTLRPALNRFVNLTFVPEAVQNPYPSDSEELKIYSQIKETFGDELAKIILNSPNERVESDVKALLARIEKMGLSKLNAFQQKTAESFADIVKNYKY